MGTVAPGRFSSPPTRLSRRGDAPDGRRVYMNDVSLCPRDVASVQRECSGGRTLGDSLSINRASRSGACLFASFVPEAARAAINHTSVILNLMAFSVHTMALVVAFGAALPLALLRSRIRKYSEISDALLNGKNSHLRHIRHEATISKHASKRPHVVLILYDDLGLGDIGVFRRLRGGAEPSMIRTPQIDALAARGTSSDQFYAGASVCTPSRATLLTGRVPPRTGLGPGVLFPVDTPVDVAYRLLGLSRGLLADEVTIADALRAAGMRTSMVGKHHIGGLSPHLPTDVGFDAYYGALHSNDMSPFEVWRAQSGLGAPWTLASPQPAQDELTEAYTNASIAELELAHVEHARSGVRTFLYVAYHAPHDPLHVRPSLAGRSPAGLYGAVVEELDDCTGRLLKTLDRLRMRSDTLVILTSDNGPWYEGATAGLRGRKAGAFEGGFRVPFIASWPSGGIGRARWLRTPSHAADIFRSVLAACNVSEPTDRILDGQNALPLWRRPPRRACDAVDALAEAEGRPECTRSIYLHNSVWLVGVRRGAYKLHLPHMILPDELVRSRFVGGHADGRTHMWLSNLAADPEEAYDASSYAPHAAKRMAADAAAFDVVLKADPRGHA